MPETRPSRHHGPAAVHAVGGAGHHHRGVVVSQESHHLGHLQGRSERTRVKQAGTTSVLFYFVAFRLLVVGTDSPDGWLWSESFSCGLSSFPVVGCGFQRGLRRQDAVVIVCWGRTDSPSPLQLRTAHACPFLGNVMTFSYTATCFSPVRVGWVFPGAASCR